MSRPDILVWSPLFAAALAVGLWAAASRHERDLLPGLITVAASCLMGFVAWDIAAAAADRGVMHRGDRIDLVMLAHFAYFSGTVFFVKSAVRRRNDQRFLAVSVGWHLLWVVGWAFVSLPLTVVFTALTVRAAALPQRGLRPALLGAVEIIATVVVLVVSVVAL